MAWLSYVVLLALDAVLWKVAQTAPFGGGLCSGRASSKLSGRGWWGGELEAAAVWRFESGWLGMCEAGGGGHGSAPRSAALGCWMFAPSRRCLFSWALVLLRMYFGSCMQSLV